MKFKNKKQAAIKVLKDFEEMMEWLKPYLPKVEIRIPKRPAPWQIS